MSRVLCVCGNGRLGSMWLTLLDGEATVHVPEEVFICNHCRERLRG